MFGFIRNTLREAGLDENAVVKINSYYYAGGDARRMVETAATVAGIQEEFYPNPGPASTAVQVTGFAFEGLLVEIEAIAVAGG